MPRVIAVSLAFVVSAAASAETVALPELFVKPGQTTPVPLEIPERYMTSNALAGNPNKEGVKAVNGKFYNVVAPIFDGSDGNTSYMRLVNYQAYTVDFTILVVGNASGNVYGTAHVLVPSSASPQYSYGDIIAKAGVAKPVGTDTGFAFYMSTGEYYTGYQHIIFNPVSQFFENLSVCQYSNDVPAEWAYLLNQALIDVHTSLVASLGYPATILVHNTANTTVNYTISVYESDSGSEKGSMTLNLKPNQSYAFPFSLIEQTIGWTPKNLEGHASLAIRRTDSQLPSTAVVAQYVYNQGLRTYVNMTQYCPISK